MSLHLLFCTTPGIVFLADYFLLVCEVMQPVAIKLGLFFPVSSPWGVLYMP